ncbi:acyl carrier protein [Nocardioides sp. S-58]|uniref:Acyl carrier protein n=1 Tax=Nocardioides renjunii TaxID=3095075 RepID=A0ABU5K6N2_9ACTN|nr:acyl carrier protein [Nocardioides sp. S-58]MDZ5660551.1 acyl carrier protein [Nocardioides sp. S-58]
MTTGPTHPTDLTEPTDLTDPTDAGSSTMTADTLATTTSPDTTLAGVVEVLARTLGIEDRAGSLTRETGLFGELPELDSLGVVELAAALEDRFDIEIDDEDFTGEVFETIGTLTDFVASRTS